VIADRFSKRSVLMVTQFAMGSTAAVLGVLAVFGWVQTWHVYVLAFLFGTGGAFDTPARQAFVNEMVPNAMLPNAVALNSASFNLARMVGPATAGVIIAVLGSGIRATGWVILLNGLSYVAVVMSLKRMHSEELHPTAPLPRAKGQLRDAVRYVRARPDILLVMGIVFFTGTFGFNFQMTTALMATQVYGKGAGEYGVLGSILAIGSLAGALIGARRGEVHQRLVIMSAIWFGLSVIVAGFMPTYLTFALMLPICGVVSMTLMTAANSFIQMAVGDEMRGRVLALYYAVFMGGTPIGAPMLGWVAEVFGARVTLIGGGIMTVAGTLATVAFVARRQGLVMTSYVRSTRHRPPDITGSTPVVTD
jgi:MFS family permease